MFFLLFQAVTRPGPDIAFRFAVEEFVAEAGPGLNYAQMRELFGRRDAAILKLMGSSDREFRAIGCEMARDRGESAWRIIAWGIASPDYNMKTLCKELLIESSCSNCRGRGYYAERQPTGVWRTARCRSCGGLGYRSVIR